MKIRHLRKEVNQGCYLGKYREARRNKQIYMSFGDGTVIYTCKHIQIEESLTDCKKTIRKI